MEYYKQSKDELLALFHSREKGLDENESLTRLKKYGPNRIREREGKNPVKIFLTQFTSPLIFILIIAGLFTYYFKEYKDTIVIMVAVLSNAFIGFVQEFNAERSMRALKKMLVHKALVIRKGHETEIIAEKLVPGDIVLLTAGSSVPADIRLLETADLNIDESALTGESYPVEKSTHVLIKDSLLPGDQKNTAFMGTYVIKGRATGIVVSTGTQTAIGRIAEKVASLHITKTPLQQKMEVFARFVTMIVLSGIAAIFITGLIKGLSTHDLFLQAIAVAVAAIPEGLPIVVTIAMAIGIQRMAQKNTIIRTLPSVETLGSTTVICSDKTGTLTQNQMTVKKIFDGKDTFILEGEGYEEKGKILKNGVKVKTPHDGLLHILKIGSLCNESFILKKNNRTEIKGDPTEGALIIAAEKAGLEQEALRKKFRLKDLIPFESGKNYMASLHQDENKKMIFVKGAPEMLFKLSTKYENGSLSVFKKEADNLAREGLRVLAVGYKEIPKDKEKITENDIKGITFAGIQGMMDPPRKEALEAIKKCKIAGIRVVMITGDHAVTARTIGENMGICKASSTVLTGEQLEKMPDSELYNRVNEVSIFARVSPEHKLRIVQQLMKRGEITAVTGDGVNDAPALRAAHIGIAMGKSGTDVAKEAANMVVRNDSFASIFQAVYEGRVVFDNIRKAVAFLIPTGFAAIITIIFTILAGIPAPYLPVQLLWINLVASGLQDVSLAFEPGDRHILKQPPRRHDEGIMSNLLLQRSFLVGFVISIGVLFMYQMSLLHGDDLMTARTIAVTTMVFFQFFQVWNSRSEKESIFRIDPFSNKVLFFALLAAFIAHMTVIYYPPLEWLFDMKPLNISQWLLIILVTSSIIAVVEADKALRKRHNNKNRNTNG